MAKKLDPQIIEILKTYGEDANEALWDCHGTWVMYHKAVERVAAKAGVVYDMPQIIEGNTSSKTAAIVVSARLGDRMEWSFGEASPANNKNAYHYAMAEKRGKDRVVLKLVGLAGMVYSEEESDDFKPQSKQDEPAKEQPNQPSKNDETRKLFTALVEDMKRCDIPADMDNWWRDSECKAKRALLPNDWHGDLVEEFKAHKAALIAKVSADQKQMEGAD